MHPVLGILKQILLLFSHLQEGLMLAISCFRRFSTTCYYDINLNSTTSLQSKFCAYFLRSGGLQERLKKSLITVDLNPRPFKQQAKALILTPLPFFLSISEVLKFSLIGCVYLIATITNFLKTISSYNAANLCPEMFLSCLN